MCLVLIQFGKLSADRLSRQIERRGASVSVVNAHQLRWKKTTSLNSGVDRTIEQIIDSNLVDFSQLVEQNDRAATTVHTANNVVWLWARKVAFLWNQLQPSAVCFGRLPSSVEEYVWYELARLLGIPMLVFNSSPVEGYSFCVKHLDDYGVFETCPSQKPNQFLKGQHNLARTVQPRPASVLLEIDSHIHHLRPAVNAFALDPLATVERVRSKFPSEVKIDVVCETKLGRAPNDWTLRSIRGVPNVELFNPDLTYTGCWDNYDGVVTVGGPIGEAAAKRGAPVITLGNPWYRMLPNVRFEAEQFADVIVEPGKNEELIRSIAWPVITGMDNRASVLNSDENIDQLARCLIATEVCGKRATRRSA